ncbi:unnamed protein product, partial [Durusdinium trenchii]
AEDDEEDADEEEEKGVKDVTGDGAFDAGDCDDVDGDDGERDETDCVLRDFQYKLTCKFMERERNLKVRTATVCFEPSSIYGNRTGYHSLLLITANDKTNQFHRTAFWRSGLTTGRKFAAGAVCHSGQSASFCGNLIAQKVFGMCRTEHLSLPGFPNFAEALRSLKAMDKVSCPNYEVCIALGNGTLVIKEALVELWSKKHAEFAAETEELLKNHNAEFNRENIKRGLEKSNESETKNEPIKKLCLEGTLEIDEFEKQHSDRLSLPCGTFTLHWCKEKALLYITAEKDCTAAANTELFGMGSGDFLQSTEAEDVMSDTSCGGRWLHFNLSGGGDSLVILDDGDRKAPPERLKCSQRPPQLVSLMTSSASVDWRKSPLPIPKSSVLAAAVQSFSAVM